MDFRGQRRSNETQKSNTDSEARPVKKGKGKEARLCFGARVLTDNRAGLRVSEALALEPRDLSLDADRPTLRARSDKGDKARVVPVHPELQAALIAGPNYADVGLGKIISASRSTAWRWVKQAAFRVEIYGRLTPGRRAGTHTF